MSDLAHMRQMERGRVLYCLDYLMRCLNDEESQVAWLTDGCPDGTLDGSNYLTEDQVEFHADFVETQQELDEFVALAAKILFREVYPGAWHVIAGLPEDVRAEVLKPERCVVT